MEAVKSTVNQVLFQVTNSTVRPVSVVVLSLIDIVNEGISTINFIN